MRAVNYRLNVKAGDTWNDFSLTWNDANGDPVDLTGYTAQLQVRATNTPTGTSILLITSAAGQLVIDALNGTITTLVSATDMTIAAGRYFYDLEVQVGSVKTTLIQGEFWVHPQITT
ncbi:MAG: hypothetical protein HC828_08710 [Blastochloris sp.]|nr:hypothetical protein [Blastochloris sp.]